MTNIVQTDANDCLDKLVYNFMSESEVKKEIDKQVLIITKSLFNKLLNRIENDISNEWIGKFSFKMSSDKYSFNSASLPFTSDPFVPKINSFWLKCGLDTDTNSRPCPQRVFKRASFLSIMETIQTKLQDFDFVEKFGKKVSLQLEIQRKDYRYLRGGEGFRRKVIVAKFCPPIIGEFIVALVTGSVHPSSALYP